MVDWQPIRRSGKPEVLGVHPQYANRLDVVVPLSARPPEEWERYLVRSYTDNPHMPWFREGVTPAPRVEGVCIRIAPLDDELESWIKGVDGRIEEANEFYERVALPELRAREEAERKAEHELQQRVDEARRRAEEL